MEITFHYPKEYEEKQKEFETHYEIKRIFVCPSTPMNFASKEEDRVCRFCNKKMPDVTFIKQAHVIPEFLGNKYWIGDDECDTCNHLFGTREQHLSNYLGISRTLNQTKGKRDIPTFESVGGGVVAGHGSFLNQTDCIIIEGKNAAKEHFTKDIATSQIRFKTKKHGYVPVYVYKSLLKIALSILPKREIKNYANALLFVFSENVSHNHLDPCIMNVCKSEFGVGPAFPIVLLYEKKDPQSSIPTHFYTLLYKNYSFNFHVPLNEKDMWTYIRQVEVQYHYPAPLFLESYEENPKAFESITKNFSSYEKVKGEVEELILTSPDFTNSRTAINPETLEVIENPIDNTGIKQLYLITNPDFVLKVKEKNTPTISDQEL